MTPLRGALLGLIARFPSSGYDLTKLFDGSLAHVWSAKHSQIYPELAAMLRDGLVSVKPAGSRGRKEYSITAKGRQELRKWLTETDPVEGIARDESMLRMFFLGFIPAKEAKGYLAAQREEHERALARYLEIEGKADDQQRGGWTGRIALEYGIRHRRLLIEWTDWAAKEVDRMAASGAKDKKAGTRRAAPRRRTRA